MKVSEFQKLKEFEDITDIDGEEGDLVLAGEHMVEQKETKKPGDSISLYKIFHINRQEGTINYILQTTKLEKE